MKDQTVLSKFWHTSIRIAACVATVLFVWLINEDSNAQQTALNRNQAIIAIQNESDAMRQEIIRSFREAPQFGDLISTNAKIKGSAGRLIQKRNTLDVNWLDEAKEIDGLIYQLESLIEAASFSQGDTTTSQASSRLANLLSLVENVKTQQRASSDPSQVGDTGLSDEEVEDFFEADFDSMESVKPITPSEPAPDWTPTTDLKATDELIFEEPMLPGMQTFDTPEITTSRSAQALISEPLILGEQPEISILEPPSGLLPPNLGLADEAQPFVLETPNIAAPAPQLTGAGDQFLPRQPQVVLRPLSSDLNPTLVAPRPTENILVPRMALAPTTAWAPEIRLTPPTPIHLYNVRSTYVPYGGYSGHRSHSHRSGYRPYGGYGGSGNGHHRGGYRAPYQNSGGFSIQIGGIRF